MNYQPLVKLYYKPPEEYAEAYLLRLNSPDTVKMDFYIAEKQAFFIQNTEVMKLAYHIAKLDKSVAKLSHNLPGVARTQYSKKCLIDEIVLTNNIEGVHSSRKEIDNALNILEKQSTAKGKYQRFVGLVNKYLKLLTKEAVPLNTCQDIRDIYDEIFLSEVIAEDPQNKPDGKIFRKDSTAVHSAADKVIHKGLYPENQIITSTEKALAFLNDDSIEELFRISIFHYLIEYIHPFYDGNGRLGRFILSYCLSDILEPLLAYRISETIKENINDYYKAFKICNDPRNLGDLTPFLIMMLQMIHLALKDLETSLTQKLISWRKYENLISVLHSENGNNKVRELYSYLIQAALFSEKGISTKELEIQLSKSYYAVQKLLTQIPKELLIAKMYGRNKFYQINLQVLNELLLKDALQQNTSK